MLMASLKISLTSVLDSVGEKLVTVPSTVLYMSVCIYSTKTNLGGGRGAGGSGVDCPPRTVCNRVSASRTV